MAESATQEMFWTAVPYSQGDDGAEELSPWEQRHELHECLGTGDGWPSFEGYYGQARWHVA